MAHQAQHCPAYPALYVLTRYYTYACMSLHFSCNLKSCLIDGIKIGSTTFTQWVQVSSFNYTNFLDMHNSLRRLLETELLKFATIKETQHRSKLTTRILGQLTLLVYTSLGQPLLPLLHATYTVSPSLSSQKTLCKPCDAWCVCAGNWASQALTTFTFDT